MGKRERICVATFAGVALFGLILYSLGEPRYHGRSLSDWLTICRSSKASESEREEAATAVRQIGAKGLPILISRATQDTSSMKEKIKAWVRNRRMLLIPTSVLNWAKRPPDYTSLNEARIGLIILGPAAAPAIPELTRLAYSGRGEWPCEALGDIGRPALPALLKILKSPTGPATPRAYAAKQFRKFSTNALVALPTLIECLKDPDVGFAASCVVAIGDLGLEPDLSIPALVKCLHSSDLGLRRVAAESIARFGLAATVVLPQIKEAESLETDTYTKTLLQQAIDRIELSRTSK
jgi:hypothetical protein